MVENTFTSFPDVVHDFPSSAPSPSSARRNGTLQGSSRASPRRRRFESFQNRFHCDTSSLPGYWDKVGEFLGSVAGVRG
ncbi:hypothetical protein B0H19DRAFT_1197635 [Mycena capillaripes]|nr:hypothetical protein B0H19DRAFT_1197635 [Mycena capillaripes]